jgi:hypothetical protein
MASFLLVSKGRYEEEENASGSALGRPHGLTIAAIAAFASESTAHPKESAHAMTDRAQDANTAAPRDELAYQIRMGEVIDDVAKRLRGVCAHMPEGDFRELMREIAAIAVKYEELADRDPARTLPPP